MLLLETDQSSVRAKSRHEMGEVRLNVRCEEQAASIDRCVGPGGSESRATHHSTASVRIHACSTFTVYPSECLRSSVVEGRAAARCAHRSGKGRWRRAKEGENRVASSGGAARKEDEEDENQPRDWSVERDRSKRRIQAQADFAQGRERLKEGDEGGMVLFVPPSRRVQPRKSVRTFCPNSFTGRYEAEKQTGSFRLGKAPIEVV